MASKMIFTLRRGWKDDTTGRDDWGAYEVSENHVKPYAGELVLEYDNGVPRLKIGDGIHEFSELEYMSVDSFLLPKPVSVTLYADKWEQATDLAGADIVDTYYQVVEVANEPITSCSKVDLNPNADQLCDFYDLGVALTAENDDGVITVYCVGDKPEKSYNIQATVTELIIEDGVIIDE